MSLCFYCYQQCLITLFMGKLSFLKIAKSCSSSKVSLHTLLPPPFSSLSVHESPHLREARPRLPLCASLTRAEMNLFSDPAQSLPCPEAQRNLRPLPLVTQSILFKSPLWHYNHHLPKIYISIFHLPRGLESHDVPFKTNRH